MTRVLALLGILLATAPAGFAPAYLPDARLTPGAVDPKLTRDVICASGWSTKSVRHTSGKLKARIYAEYGIKSRAPGQYEVDHLIPLEIGGADVQPNLWPEPYSLDAGGVDLGARTKDRVENAAHKAVCGGRMTLADAQQQMRSDWTKLYIKLVSPTFPAYAKP